MAEKESNLKNEKVYNIDDIIAKYSIRISKIYLSTLLWLLALVYDCWRFGINDEFFVGQLLSL